MTGDHKGARMYERFHLTQAASWKLAKFAKAVGQSEQWDAEDEERSKEVLCSRPIVVNVTTWTTNKGDERPQLDRGQMEPFSGDISEEMEKIVCDMEDYSHAYKNRSAAPASSGGSFGANDDVPF